MYKLQKNIVIIQLNTKTSKLGSFLNYYYLDTFEDSVQFSSVTQLCLTLCDPMDCSMPGLPVHHQLPEPLKLLSIESVMPSNHLILCHPLLLLPSVFPSIRVFSNEIALHTQRRKWQPTPVFLPGESQGGGSLVGCHLWESDTTEMT